MSQANHIRKVAIVGATGTLGKFIVEELLKLGQHEITAITRTDSKAVIPNGVKSAKVDYDDHASLVNGLRGQDALIITMSINAPKENHSKLVKAAAEANVPYVLPNEWGVDSSKMPFGQDVLVGPGHVAILKQIEELGKSSWISVITGFWYEYSIAIGPNSNGFDYKNRTVTFIDDGETKINFTTWEQTARAVANLLALPITPEKPGAPSLSGYKNKHVYVASFLVSQKDMFASILRVTGEKESDWKISYEDSTKRYEDGKKQLFGGDRVGFQKLLYTRTFYKDGSGNFEARETLQNEALGLPKEDLGERTKAALVLAEQGITYG
ncbi:CipA protein [Biscogniauxia mediterranea]|nr:CipA protein [Biscogniauxia mediterranea]